MSEPGKDEFYVGYLPQAPAGLASWVRLRVVLLLALVAAVALVLVLSQRPFAVASFEFGTTRSFEGVLQEHPYPTLLVERPGGGTSSFLLVAFGKRGAAESIAGIREQDGRRVRVDGTLVYRDDQTMIEVTTLLVLPPDAEMIPFVPLEDLGVHTFAGEIVDSKCFLGVMKPGNLKPHRACATRCISGGIPPVLLVRDGEGTASYLLLTDGDGFPVNDRVLHLVAEPIEVTGRLVRRGDQLVLQADPASFARLP
jgi:hypothetical protein